MTSGVPPSLAAVLEQPAVAQRSFPWNRSAGPRQCTTCPTCSGSSIRYLTESTEIWSVKSSRRSSKTVRFCRPSSVP